ncbi:hemolysin XhlA family protein [Myxosarcina sp. GI1]|uniref:hemolysin XhlA family protein n=1 Tax=Myxosarcina sp. GI1 TaxID=1541065 RepID=UPI00055E4152|nr:hemolysin XhlA family protein [Myxosarcina sp. GI1]
MSNIQIETDLKEILRELKEGQKAILNKVEETNNKVEDIDKRLVRVETKLDGTVEDIKEIKGSQKAQIWTLIGVLITAVGGFVVAVGRSVLTFNP